MCADELATDLTSFFVLIEEKRRQRREVLSTLARGLEKITELDDIDVNSFLTDRMTNLGAGFLGGILTFTLLAAGIWPVAVLTGGISALFAFGNWNEELEAEVFRSFRSVGSNLDESTPREDDC